MKTGVRLIAPFNERRILKVQNPHNYYGNYKDKKNMDEIKFSSLRGFKAEGAKR